LQNNEQQVTQQLLIYFFGYRLHSKLNVLCNDIRLTPVSSEISSGAAPSVFPLDLVFFRFI